LKHCQFVLVLDCRRNFLTYRVVLSAVVQSFAKGNIEKFNVDSCREPFLWRIHSESQLLSVCMLCMYACSACSVGCPAGSYESSPCSNFADRVCVGKSSSHFNIHCRPISRSINTSL